MAIFIVGFAQLLSTSETIAQLGGNTARCTLVPSNRATTFFVMKDNSDSGFTPGSFSEEGSSGNGGSYAYLFHNPFGEKPQPAKWEMGPLNPGHYYFSAYWPALKNITGQGMFRITAKNGERVVAENGYYINQSLLREQFGMVRCSDNKRLVGSQVQWFTLNEQATSVTITLEPMYSLDCFTSKCAIDTQALVGMQFAADTVLLEKFPSSDDIAAFHSSQDEYYRSLGFVCGNGKVEGNETCDDGNTNANDYCSITCTSIGYCGDKVTQENEECDDGNTWNNDECDDQCKKTSCYDGMDDDFDGVIDTKDPGCYVGFDVWNPKVFNYEGRGDEKNNNGKGQCFDGIDNEGDGKMDSQEEECLAPPSVTRARRLATADLEGSRIVEKRDQVPLPSVTADTSSPSFRSVGALPFVAGSAASLDPVSGSATWTFNCIAPGTYWFEASWSPMPSSNSGVQYDVWSEGSPRKKLAHFTPSQRVTPYKLGQITQDVNGPISITVTAQRGETGWVRAHSVTLTAVTPSASPACVQSSSSSSQSNSAIALVNCTDGTDNDGDGFTDDKDPGCHSDGDVFNATSFDPARMAENANNQPTDECSDGRDNDGDGLIDSQEPICHHDANVLNGTFVTLWVASPMYESAVPRFNIRCTTTCTWDNAGTCADGKDNNGNGLKDAQEPECHTDQNPTNTESFNPLRNEPTAVTSTSSVSSVPIQASSTATTSIIMRDDADSTFTKNEETFWSKWEDGSPIGGMYWWGGGLQARAMWNMGAVPAGTYKLEGSWYGYPSGSTFARYKVKIEGMADQEFVGNHSTGTPGRFSWQAIKRADNTTPTIVVTGTKTVRIELSSGDGADIFVDAVRLVRQ